MRGAATQAMSDIVEERQQRRCPPAAAPLRAAARRLAGFVARSSHTATGIARRSRLASGPGGLQQNVKLFLREPLATYSRNPLEMFLVPRNRPVDAVDDVFRLAETVTFARVAEHDGLDARVLQRDVELLALCNRHVVVVLAVNEERRRLHLRRIAQR